MRAGLTATGAALMLAGCASFSGLEPATPADYTGPTVNVADQAVQVSGQLLHIFEMTHVDGRRLSSTSMATVRANQGRGFAVAPVALTNELPLRPGARSPAGRHAVRRAHPGADEPDLPRRG